MQVKRILVPATLAASVLAILGAVVLIKTDGPAAPREVSAASMTGPLRSCTADSGWANQGAKLRAEKKGAFADKARTAPGVRIFNSGDFAYSSQPVDLRGDGSYTFDFGPLPANFAWPSPDLVFSVQWPGDFKGRVLAPQSPEKVVAKPDGSRYLEAVLPVDGASCTGLVLWYY